MLLRMCVHCCGSSQNSRKQAVVAMQLLVSDTLQAWTRYTACQLSVTAPAARKQLPKNGCRKLTCATCPCAACLRQGHIFILLWNPEYSLRYWALHDSVRGKQRKVLKLRRQIERHRKAAEHSNPREGTRRTSTPHTQSVILKGNMNLESRQMALVWLYRFESHKSGVHSAPQPSHRVSGRALVAFCKQPKAVRLLPAHIE